WVLVNGKRKRPHLFRIVLSHSRKGYSEVVWQQTTESFIRCLENAFRYFEFFIAFRMESTPAVDFQGRYTSMI
ncbi:MAG: hypothetical protein ACLP00_16160, partial [Terracidiphilus sp.]